MPYIRALAGIRGLAIILVMLFHFGYLPAGWVGVQIFFVLSGYLITTILLADRSSSPLEYFARFYWRRALRIFPLFYLFILALAAIHMATGCLASLPADWPWLVTYTANFARLREGDLPNVVHLWSLAVEEQFYLVWPFVIFLTSRRCLCQIVLVLIVATPILRIIVFNALHWVGTDATYAAKTVYVLPLTQVDAFAAGAAIPLFGLDKLRNSGSWFLGALALAALAGVSVVLVGHFWFGGAFFMSFGFTMYMVDFGQYAWGYSIINIAALLGIVFVLQGNWFTRVFDSVFLVHIGKISYGAYVYHLPLLAVATALSQPHTWHGRIALFAGWFIVVLATAELSFRFMESRFLGLKDRIPGTRWGATRSASSLNVVAIERKPQSFETSLLQPSDSGNRLDCSYRELREET